MGQGIFNPLRLFNSPFLLIFALVIYLNDDIQDFDWKAALPLLSEQRREQTLKFKHELGRKTCAAAYLLLCEALRSEYGIEEPPVFEYGEHGKPSIVGRPDIHFNLSHCREGVLCMVSNHPVGVDIESIREYKESLARYTMNDEEMATILHADRPDVAFTRFWTQKEAVLKRSGQGISNNMKDVLNGFEGSFHTVVNEAKNYVYSIIN